MIPFKISQTVKTNDGRVGRVLFYTELGNIVVLFPNKWAETFPLSKLTAIIRDEYDEAVKAKKEAAEAILQHLVVTESAA